MHLVGVSLKFLPPNFSFNSRKRQHNFLHFNIYLREINQKLLDHRFYNNMNNIIVKNNDIEYSKYLSGFSTAVN